MIAAISAAQKGAEVTVLEGGDRVGRKILATGNGKCNFTNKYMDEQCYRSNTTNHILQYLEAFGVEETLAFFENLQMLYKDKNGYYYPASEQASTVLDVLRFAMEDQGDRISVLTERKASGITVLKDHKVKVQCGTESYIFDRVILTCGGKASPKTGSDGSGYQLLRSLKCGCVIEEPVPALVQLRCKENWLKAVAGVRTEGKVTLLLDGKVSAESQGEIQLTEYGVSGIPVFQISRFASYGCIKGKNVQVKLDLMPHMEISDFTAFMVQRKKVLQDRTMEQFCAGLIHRKICQLFCKLSGTPFELKVGKVSDKQFENFVKLFKDWNVTVERPNGFDMAQVCAGGLSMQEITRHFSLKKCPSVYVAGELLDVDGICGGYNLQWAWTSGYLAGMYAASER